MTMQFALNILFNNTNRMVAYSLRFVSDLGQYSVIALIDASLKFVANGFGGTNLPFARSGALGRDGLQYPRSTGRVYSETPANAILTSHCTGAGHGGFCFTEIFRPPRELRCYKMRNSILLIHTFLCAIIRFLGLGFTHFNYMRFISSVRGCVSVVAANGFGRIGHRISTLVHFTSLGRHKRRIVRYV
jgi:hypothetical protein